MRFLPILICLTLLSCNNPEKETLTGQALLDLAINAAGGQQFFNAEITFEVNDLDYTMYRKNHVANFSVETQKDTMAYLATYKNGYPEYFINGISQEIDGMSKRFIDNNLDAFLYLTSIPHVFQQNGVKTTLKDDTTIDQKVYYTLYMEVPQGAGLPNDEFYLYINKETYYVEFSAENFQLNGTVPMFKRFYNHRMVNNLLFSDYYTFYPLSPEITVDMLCQAYKTREIKEGNEVAYKNIKVVYHTHE